MKWPGDKPLHTLLLLTEKPAQWAAWKIWPIALLLAGGCAGMWAWATGLPALGWAAALCLLAFALADWALLASLPRRGLSFGAVQPPWLGLLLLRFALTLAAATVPGRPVVVLLGLTSVHVIVCGLMAYGTYLEPFRLQVSRVQLPAPKLSNPGMPLRILHISDLHVERLTRRERALPALVAELAPDLIVLTGDYLSTSFNADSRAVADLQTLLAQFHAPGGVYAIFGTPEVDLPAVLRPAFAGLDIVLLEDRAVELAARGHRLWLIGLSCNHDRRADAAKLRGLLAGAPPEALSLLLYHTPDLMPAAAALGVDLVLAGHTHGGQWRLPGFGAILTSSRYWKRYEAGLYRDGLTYMVVSQGLGMEGFGAPRARFFCPPELVLISLAETGRE